MSRLKAVVLFLLLQVTEQSENSFFSSRKCLDGADRPSRDAAADAGNSSPIRMLAYNLAPTLMVQWNSTGAELNLTGFYPYIVHLVANRIGRSYCWVPLGQELPVDGSNGHVAYLMQGKGDLVVAPLLRTPGRYQMIDFTVPTFHGPFGVMIPLPDKSINRNALGQPFRLEVWINVIVAVVVVIFVLYASALILRHADSPAVHRTKIGLNDAVTYVLTTLLTQGNYYANQKTASRFVAGAWCLAALILVSAYSGTLLSFIMSPVSKPVVDSFYDIANVPGLKVALDGGKTADLLLHSGSQDKSTSFSSLMTTIDRSLFRCNKSEDCLEKVRTEGYVYIHGKVALEQMIVDDVAQTGNCRYSMAKEPFWSGFLSWAVPKRWPLSKDTNRALLELDAFGLTDFWKKKFSTVASKCMSPKKSVRSGRLSLPHLSATFALLGIGLGLGILAFLVEKIVHNYRTLRKGANVVEL